MAENGTKNKLNARQHRAIKALLVSKNTTEAALTANVAERTLYRWLSDPEFKAELSQAEGNIIDETGRRLIALCGLAIETLENILSKENASDTLKLRAAQAVQDYTLKLRELRNVEQRLAELEAAVYGNQDK